MLCFNDKFTKKFVMCLTIMYNTVLDKNNVSSIKLNCIVVKHHFTQIHRRTLLLLILSIRYSLSLRISIFKNIENCETFKS